jgi:surface antigen
MSFRDKRFLPALALLFAVTGCAPAAAPGDAGPPLLGPGAARIDAPVRGTLIGAFVGQDIGRQLVRGDIEHARTAQQQAYVAVIGQPVAWTNPDTGHGGTITPTREGRDAQGRSCREYRTTLTVAGETRTTYGTACRNADGTSTIVNN